MRPLLLSLLAFALVAGLGWHYQGRLLAWYRPLEAMPTFSRALWVTNLTLGQLPLPPFPPEYQTAAALPATEDEAEIQFRAACDFFRKAKYRYAGVAFQEVLELDRQRDDARRLMALSFLLAAEGERAVGPLVRLEKRLQQNQAEGQFSADELAFFQGLARLQQGQFAAAAEWLLPLVTSNSPFQAEALRRLTQMPGVGLLPPSSLILPAAPANPDNATDPETRQPDNSEEEQPTESSPA